MTVEERTAEKKAELMQTFKELSEDQLKIAADLISQAAFMSVTLDDLAERINKNGTTEEYTNGAHQSGRKISSDAKLYSSLIAKYTMIVTKLLKLIPGEKKGRAAKDPLPAKNKYTKPAQTAAEEMAKQSEMDNAFLKAVLSGEVKQIEYREFCEKWREQNL